MPRQQQDQTFDEVVDAYYGRVFRGALSVTGDKHLAEEIVQETFLSAFRKFDGYSGKSSVFSWLYSIMLNKYRDHCRRAKLRKRLGFVRADASLPQTRNAREEDCSPCAELASSEEGELLIQAVYRLPVRLREVVAMRYFDGLPLNEVSRILNCRLGTVKSRLAKARKRLWQMLHRRFL
jgi:RNA polymerase sigma-70 factor (ECF subfamily)